MTTIPAGLVLRGEIRSAEDLTIAGRVRGPISVERSVVTVEATAEIDGDILADDITVFGRVNGQLIATDIVDVRPGARVTGHVIAKRFILHEGAEFEGRVEPQHLEAALRVARFQQKKRDAAS